MARIKPTLPRPDLPAASWRECWAKTLPDGRLGVDVYRHCVTVGRVAEALITLLPPAVRAMLPAGTPALAASHDVGKVTPGFQLQALAFRDAIRAHLPHLAAADGCLETSHAKVSEAAVNAWLGGHPLDPPFAAAVVVGAHHGDRDDGTPRIDSIPRMGGATWAAERRGLIEALVDQFGALPSTIEPAAIDVVSGLVTVADWIGSDERYFPPDRPPVVEDLPQLARDAITRAGWFVPTVRPGLSFEDVFGRGYRPRPSQAAFVESVTGPGLYILEAPMGEGKTEAALYAAYRLMAAGHHHGIYFGLPTRLTSDRIHARVTRFLEAVCADFDPRAFLAHGDAWLKAFGAGGEAFRPGGEWFHARKRGLLYPFAVGTIDQALLSVLNVRHAFVRAFGLAGKVVILDEVHSYDSYTGTLLDELVASLLKHDCTVIVLSATLTHDRRRQIGRLPALAGEARPGVRELASSYPLITTLVRGQVACHAPPAASRACTVHVDFLEPNDDTIAVKVVRAATAGACVVCIANTVGRAQRWYNAVCEATPEGAFPVGLLHSKFTGRRRAELENEWIDRLGPPDGSGDSDAGGKSRPHGCVLIATQIVEQSVDIDADLMISELAPTDMLLQRAGRLWRHERERRPMNRAELWVVAADLGDVADAETLLDRLGRHESAAVYAPYVLWRSYQVWRGRSAVALPGDIRELIERTYAPVADQPAFVGELQAALEQRRAGLRQYAVAAMSYSLPTTGDEERIAPTRWSEVETYDALLVRGWEDSGAAGAASATITLCDGRSVRVHASRPDMAATAALHESRVAVPAWMFRGVRTPAVLCKHTTKGVPMPVLLIGDDGRLTHDSDPTALAYDDRRGLQRIQTASTSAVPRTPIRCDTGSDSKPPHMEDFIDEFDW